MKNDLNNLNVIVNALAHMANQQEIIVHGPDDLDQEMVEVFNIQLPQEENGQLVVRDATRGRIVLSPEEISIDEADQDWSNWDLYNYFPLQYARFYFKRE